MQEPQEQSQEPQLIPASEIRVRKLTTKQIAHISRAFRPTPEMVSDMIKSICMNGQNWNRPRLAAIMCIHENELRAYEMMLRKPSGVVARLVWWIHTLNTKPELALSYPHIISWGRVAAEAAYKRVHLDKTRRQQIIDELRACAQSKYTLPPGRKSVVGLSKHYGIGVDRAARLASKAGYRCADGRKKTYRRQIRRDPTVAPNSIWMHTDWNEPLHKIAERHRVTQNTVAKALRKLRLMPRAALLRQLKAIGIQQPRRKFKRVFNPPEAWVKQHRPRTRLSKVEKLSAFMEKSYAEDEKIIQKHLTQNNTQPTISRNDEEHEETPMGPQAERQQTAQVQLQRESGQCEVSQPEQTQGPEDRGSGQ